MESVRLSPTSTVVSQNPFSYSFDKTRESHLHLPTSFYLFDHLS